MDASTLICVGGVYHLGWALFDFFWPYLFNWRKTLLPLDDFNRPILRITSKLLSFLYATLAYFSFFHVHELLETGIGRSLLIFTALFWTIRAGMQIRFYGFKKANKIMKPEMPFALLFRNLSNRSISTMMFVIMTIGIALYFIPTVLTL
jgi:hypothetical protein